MKKSIILFFLVAVFACKNTPKVTLKPFDLMQYGIPMTIMAPDSAKVDAGSLGFTQDVTVISKKDNYNIQIFASDATTTNMESVKTGHLTDTKADKYFSKIVQEDPDGFLFEMKYDSLNTNYGFKYLKVQGDKEYSFQTGLVGKFSLEEAKMMYEAVKQK